MMLINAGFGLGKNVTWSPSYGSEMRGGTANCNVVISDEEIGSPVLEECDILIALNQPSIEKFKDAIEDGGYMFVNSSIVDKDFTPAHDVEVVKLPVTEMANEMGNPKGANLIMLGAVAKKTGLFGIDDLVDQIDAYFGKKGITNPKNADCLRLGYESV